MDQSKIEKPQEPYEELEEHRAHLKKKSTKAIIRGVLFLIGTIVLTYYAKFYHSAPKVPKSHGMAGWIFSQDTILHVLVVGPDDNQPYSNTNEGERFFFNPIEHLRLDSNYIRYPEKDLYMLGQVETQMILSYCAHLDSGYSLHIQGDSVSVKGCEKKLDLIDSSSERLSGDWALQSSLMISDSGTTLIIKRAGNSMVITDNPYLPFSGDSSQLYISTHIPQNTAQLPNARVFISPKTAFSMGKIDSNLIAVSGHALGLVWEKDGRLLLRKLWLKQPLSGSFLKSSN